jgi:hypothetical protein
VFRSTLKGPPYEIVVEAGDCGSHVAVVEIARDDTRVVAVSCELAGMIMEGEPFAEFSFSILVLSLDDSGEPFETQDRHIAAKYIPAIARHKVMPLVCYCLQSLIEKVQPPGVYRVAKEPNPPEKALRKHHMLTEVLTELGYHVHEQGTDPFGRRFCTMRRNPN